METRLGDEGFPRAHDDDAAATSAHGFSGLI